MKSGCVGYVFKIGTAVLSAILLAAGALVLIFGAFNLDSSNGMRTILTVVAGMGAIYVFVRVGKDILHDLRGESDEEGPGPDKKT